MNKKADLANLKIVCGEIFLEYKQSYSLIFNEIIYYTW